MIELKNSKTTYLGKAPDGRNKFALDCHIGAVQMREEGKDWEDIKPRLVRDTDGWHIEGAPYYAKVKDDGSRLFCPDRQDYSKRLWLPTFPLVKRLQKKVVISSTKIDKQILPNHITMPFPFGEIRYIFANSGIRFEILLNKAPQFDRIQIPIDLAGFDIFKLLAEKQGLGIPRPRLISSNLGRGGLPVERFLDWSYKNGQLELGFDLSGLQFPILLKNTTFEKRVGASLDDITAYYNGSAWIGGDVGDNQCQVGWYNDSFQMLGSGMRFLDITVAKDATITTAKLTVIAKSDFDVDTVNSDLHGELAANAATFSNDADSGVRYTDYNDRTRTTASVIHNAIANWTDESTYDTPEIKTIIQEIVNQAGWASGNALVIFWDDHDDNSNHDTNCRRYWYSWDADPAKVTLLHIEYTEAAAVELGAFYQRRNSFGLNIQTCGQVRAG